MNGSTDKLQRSTEAPQLTAERINSIKPSDTEIERDAVIRMPASEFAVLCSMALASLSATATPSPSEANGEGWGEVDGFQGVLDFTGHKDATRLYANGGAVFCITEDHRFMAYRVPPVPSVSEQRSTDTEEKV